MKELPFAKPKRRKRSTLKKAKDRAWKAFSIYVRSKNAKDGMVQCYTCEKWFPIKQMSAGHGIPGRNNAVLLLEEVVRPQCAGCNIWGRGQYRIFTRKLIDELGLDVYDELSRMSNETVIFKESDWEDKERIYTELFNNL